MRGNSFCERSLEFLKVATLIPVMSRLEFVERSVAYYDSLNSPHPVYIGGASDLGRSSLTINPLKRFKNVEENYFKQEGLNGNLTCKACCKRLNLNHYSRVI